MSTHPFNALTSLLTAVALGATAAPSLARGPGTNCPDSVTGQRANLQPEVFQQLDPGTTQNTPGTSAASNPDLDGFEGATVTKTVSWSTTSGAVSARVRQKVYDSATHPDVCSCTYQVVVLPESLPGTSICAVRVINFIYPKTAPLYGAFRTDGQPKGQVKSATVARSTGKGRSIRFALENCATPGQTSKPMTLVFQADQILKDGYVRLEAQDGSLSPPIKVYNPYVP